MVESNSEVVSGPEGRSSIKFSRHILWYTWNRNRDTDNERLKLKDAIEDTWKVYYVSLQ